MAKEVSYEEGWWKTRSSFTSNENFDDEMLRCGNEEKITGDDRSVDPNMCNENQMKELEVGLTGGGGDDQIIDVGVAQKRKGKEIDLKNEGDDQKRKRYHQPCNSETRVSAERRRRNIEAKLYDELLALLPRATAKDHKAIILEEAMNTIKSLEETLHGLEKQKLERLHGASQSSNTFKTCASSNVTLSVCGVDALISICSKRIPELFSTICFIFEKRNLDVLYTEISSDPAKTMYMIRVRCDVPPELAEGFPYEEMYEEAVAQIAHLVTLHN